MSRDRSDPSRRLEEIGQSFNQAAMSEVAAPASSSPPGDALPSSGRCGLLLLAGLLPFLLAGAGLAARLVS